MSHPGNRLERFVIGDTKGKRRGAGYWDSYRWIKDPNEREKAIHLAAARRRNTTKLCSCAMCGNQRRLYGLSMQEIKNRDSSLTDI
jgi:hypothetical protein